MSALEGVVNVSHTKSSYKHLLPSPGSTTYMGQKPSELNNSLPSENYGEQPAADPSYESSPWTSEVEQTLPRTFMDDPTHQSEWNGKSHPSLTFLS